ncbi:hypothetical protein M1852_15730 (plasmid) [Lactiplantibacillus plantarum]|nr:hypothetical protein [Lactiplantibacillus plantarum]WHQ52996.1 hypothetical protein M1852_15730 [Lactiplantibacillus plantarum]
MSRQKRSIKENNDKLKVQLELLRSYTEHFDSGMIHMALPMATQVRVLMHQTNNSSSLLHQLDLENKLKLWHSPNSSFSPHNLLTTWDLLTMSIGSEGASYLPLGSKEVFNRRPDDSNNIRPEIFLPLELWWNQIVFSQQSDYVSRKDIVLFIANKDGGSHVDEEKWPIDNYKESQLLGFYNQNGDSPDGNPLYAAMRQIVEEILVSFEVFESSPIRVIPSFNNKHLYFNFLRDRSYKSNDQSSFQIRDFSFKYYDYDKNNWSFIDKSEPIIGKDCSIIEVK